MKIDKINLEIKRYYSDDKPTCAVDFKENKVCVFFRTERFGTFETCLFAPIGDINSKILDRGDNNFLIPGSWCPLFNEEMRKKL